MMEVGFDLHLVEKFIASVRKMGADVLPSSHSFSETNNVSTPILTWLFSNRNKLPSSYHLNEILLLDVDRQKHVIGNNIIKTPRNEYFLEKEELYQQAMSTISEVWPEIFALTETISPRISFQTDDRKEFESESDPKTFGEIIFNMKSTCPMYWAEIIVHEISHHYLTVLLGTIEIDGDLKNKFKKLRFSHQRSSERPLIGILHGVFAQTCILHFATNVILDPAYNLIYKAGARKSFDRYSKIFLKDLNTVRDEGLLFMPELISRSSEVERRTLQIIEAEGGLDG